VCVCTCDARRRLLATRAASLGASILTRASSTTAGCCPLHISAYLTPLKTHARKEAD
jgi:hypothetical protein